MPSHRFGSVLRALLVLLCGSLAAAAAPKSGTPRGQLAGQPQANGQFRAIDEILNQAVEEHDVPGAVVLIGHNGHVVYRKAFGWRSLEPRRERMTPDTIFDVASLTKCMATAVSVMRLVQAGQVRLNDPVANYLPEFGANGKDQITVRQLLTHYSGLPEDLDLKQPWSGYSTGIKMAMDVAPLYPPGTRFLYSDINFEVLGELVRRVSGVPLDKYAEQHIYQPLQMAHTAFNPPRAWRLRIAPTQYDEHGVMLRGVVHDPTARRMGGVAGHAGLFTTADDAAKFAQAMLDGGAGVLSPMTVEKMSTPQQPPTATVVRGLGWDIDSPFSSNRGELLPVGSFGHTGFTGTSLWIDPVTRTYIVLFANAVHPRGGTPLASLRSRVATAVAAALKLNVGEQEQLRLARLTGYNEAAAGSRLLAARNGQVKTGIDVLEEHDFAALRRPDGRAARVGLITNQTGIDSQGRRTIDVLAHAPGVELTIIFSPEHGLAGVEDRPDLPDGKDAATGIPVFSTYGSNRFRPPPAEILQGLDAVIYDMQDAGVRFYTYETTAVYFLQAAAQAGIEMIILDRPNPLTGAVIQGPLSDPEVQSYTNAQSLPVRHGMTIGELAKMYNQERKVGAKLTVIPAEGWMRGDWFDSTGLLWIDPSPNLRNFTELVLYPGVAMIEGTNVSVGRGTDTPFELVGAPWVKPKELADYLNARLISGVRFVPTTFTPAVRADKAELATPAIYNGQACGGVSVVLLNRNLLDAPEMGIELAAALHKLYPTQFKMEKMMPLVLNKPVMDALEQGVDPRRIAQDWRDDVQQFDSRRKPFLLY